MTNNIMYDKFNRTEVTVFILGGYHAEGIKNYLKARGVSYEKILTNIGNYTDKMYYEDIVRLYAKYFGITNNADKIYNDIRDKIQLIHNLDLLAKEFNIVYLTRYENVGELFLLDKIKIKQLFNKIKNIYYFEEAENNIFYLKLCLYLIFFN